MKTGSSVLALLATSIAALPGSPTVAMAEDQAPSQQPAQGQTRQAQSDALEEVTVTARKRQESILNVPVIEQALGADQLQKMQVTELADLPNLVPGLELGHSLLSIGTLVSIRGIGTASQDPGVDQSVSLNIDGLSLGNGLAFNSGLFDLAQVEVLKGPQALFYGKSSPGGVIALHTADPTDQVEVIGRAAYEFESVNPRGEFILSGPVTDTLKLRLATMYSSADGYFDNVATALPGTGAVTPTDRHSPDSTDYMIRGTALWDPISQLSARLKVNFVHDRTINAENFQCTNAPTGTGPVPGFPPFLGGEPCDGLSRTERLVFLDPAAFPDALNNGVPFLETNQAYGTLELNYSPGGGVSFTSTTGYYNLSSESMVNPSESAYAGPFIGVNNRFHRREATEEVRANSDFKGPVNFTLGALYERGNLGDHVTVVGNNTYGLPPVVEDGNTPVDITTASVFGQVRWNIVERLELAGGLRWTDETRTENPFNFLTEQPTVVPDPAIHSKVYSPEVTLTYRPTDDLTAFAAWKKGFKSGSFSVATPAVTDVNNAFGDEQVHGGELGLKSRLLEHRLAVNVAVYDYDYSGLQVGVISPPVNGLPSIQTLNAATARTYGLDLDAAFHPQSVAGLGLNGALNWNHGRYTKFDNAPCWGGQLISEGCNLSSAGGPNTAQDLSGTPLIRAPDWQVHLGFDYAVPIQSGYTLTFSNSNAISSRYVTFLAVDRPNNDNYQGSFAKVDVSLSLLSPSNLWEVALIGKDINDKLTSGNCVASPLETGATVANPSGVATRAQTFGIDPAGCFADPGREVWLRLTVRPFAKHD
jgi:iron complex outermembrane recepter protein